MAAAAPAVSVLSTANAMADGEDSNLSSPLSEVEDKDGEPDDPDAMALDDPEPRDVPSDSESNLSEANDTEAETERLYDTPQVSRRKNVILGQIDEDETAEVTPTKQSTVVVADGIPEEDEPLSDVDISAPPSSPPEEIRSPIKSPQSTSADEKRPSSDAKKRKRSPMVDRSDSEGPLRKRATSTGVPELDSNDGDKTTDQKTGKANSVRSGSGVSADAKGVKDGSPLGVDSPTLEPVVAKKMTRNGRKQAKAALTNGVENKNEDGLSDEETEPRGDDDGIEADPDDDIDVAGRHGDEEAERKRIAIDEWSTIEEKFSIFRDRLYKDRLEKLEREEQALCADVPYHPEYLNMKQCLDELHDQKIRKINKEYELILEANDRVAVARRAIIWGQFYQGIREARERMLSELNKEWHETQNARRNAHRAPDYSLSFPSAPAQRTRNAVAYNTEVSILSGMAKHIGFPAAPPMRGASLAETEEDIDAIRRARRQRQQSMMQHQMPAFSGALDSAGEQFIKNTPWANPNHPHHQLHKIPSGSQPDLPVNAQLQTPRFDGHGVSQQPSTEGLSGRRQSASPEMVRLSSTQSHGQIKRVGSAQGVSSGVPKAGPRSAASKAESLAAPFAV
ncbi:hypothetical protein jhhlp_002281 [Lomentospora prolificans]|uniref:Transcriptional regulatory protein DEP1 n=1 Tax=Lomentospora prolificans TaxID=41688 RepID=A0A2N3NDM7_9PEZI|nr:hypothetical protein jhhlp_002281 [Lomentospora prolificans]